MFVDGNLSASTRPNRSLPKLAYSVSEFLGATGLGRSRFYSEVRAGRLRLTKVGRRSLVLADDARAWVSALARPSRGAEGAGPATDEERRRADAGPSPDTVNRCAPPGTSRSVTGRDAPRRTLDLVREVGRHGPSLPTVGKDAVGHGPPSALVRGASELTREADAGRVDARKPGQ
jgi:hypothetical protein